MLTKRKRQIWKGLATYANGLEVDVKGIRETIYLCMPWVARTAPFAQLNVESDLFSLEGFAKYHAPIKNLLTALCGCRGEKLLPTEALEFLKQHGEHVENSFDPLPDAPNDSEHIENITKHWHPNGEPRESPLGTAIRSKNYYEHC